MQIPEHACPADYDPNASIFSPERFVCRGDCGEWHQAFEVVYKVSHNMLAAAYISIAAILVAAWVQSRDGASVDRSLTPTERRRVFAFYAVFIALCGVGHLEGSISFHLPAYHAFALWHALTALVSWIAVVQTYLVAQRIASKL